MGEGQERKRARLPEGGAVKAGLSIAPLVRQGLRAKDSSSLEKVLAQSDRGVIDCTVAECTGPEAFDLLQECTWRMMYRPLTAMVLVVWIKAILTRHCAYIRSQPVLGTALVPLFDALESRVTSF